jgi:plasmid maintenance system antidote protein VapI
MVGESLFHSMHADPIETQQAICEAITELIRDGQAEISRLEALLALERQTQPMIDLLLTQYVEGDAQIGSFEWKAWNAALRLSQTFGQAHEFFLRHIAKIANGYWTDPEPLIRVQLFHHRKVELLLRFLRYKKRSPEIWKQLHRMYRLAHERDLLNRLGRTIGELEQQ